jgi:hypothetical protein
VRVKQKMAEVLAEKLRDAVTKIVRQEAKVKGPLLVKYVETFLDLDQNTVLQIVEKVEFEREAFKKDLIEEIKEYLGND